VSQSSTPLASGTLNGHDQLIVELVESEDAAKHPPLIAIRWPTKATVTTPAAYDQMAANAMRLLAAASTAIAQLKARRQL
jgi:hypothetical protein